MKLKMLVGMAGPTISLSPGDERDFEQGEAERLIAAGYAVPVSEKRAERAVKPAASEARAKG